MSHPSWVRGLKCRRPHRHLAALPVAPFMGVWIEMMLRMPWHTFAIVSHPSWVRGLKSHGGSALYGYLQVSPFMGKKNVNLL